MFAIKESALQESWLSGAVVNATLVTPVIDARLVVSGDEETIRMLRGLLESVFEQWRDAHGTFPESTGGLLGSFNQYEGKTIAECPPYACMGNRWADYADLLAKLTAEQYPPLVELETIANGDNLRDNLPDSIPRLPPERQHNFRYGMQRILAALILSEAAAGNVESATKAWWALDRIKKEIQRHFEEAKRASDHKLHQFALTGVKSHLGPKKRAKDKDILVFQKEAAPLFKANGYNIAKTLREPTLAAYVHRHYGAHTLRDALKKIRPKDAGPKGRPKKR